MVQLLENDIRTREVLDWTGVHLFHFHGSSCSQKTRIFLNLKGIDWVSHPIDLSKNENYGAWYLGINPRGLVPTLVMGGEVHIESNDIMLLLERCFPTPSLVPEPDKDEIAKLLHHEDDLHLDLRTITFRFTQPRGRAPKSAEALASYRSGGSGTVRGQADPNKAREIAFWEWAAREGISDEAVRTSATRFRTALHEIDGRLASSPYLMGEDLSVLDIAWFIYVNRLFRCGWPIERLHPNVWRWFTALRDRPEFANEITVPPDVQAAVEENHHRQREARKTLIDVAGL